MDDWKTDLEIHFKEQKEIKKEIEAHKESIKKQVKRFIKKEVLPAFEALEKELKKYKRDMQLDKKKDRAVLMVRRKKKKEFVYEINIRADGEELMVNKSVYTPNKKGKLKLGVEGKISNLENSPLLGNISRDDIVADFLIQYKESTSSREF
jgi:hypothetical protein